MKIADVKAYPVWAGRRNVLIVKVESDDGYHGWGESGVVVEQGDQPGIEGIHTLPYRRDLSIDLGSVRRRGRFVFIGTGGGVPRRQRQRCQPAAARRRQAGGKLAASWRRAS